MGKDASSTSLNHRGSKHLSRPLLRTQNSPQIVSHYGVRSFVPSSLFAALFDTPSIFFFFFFALCPFISHCIPSIAVLVRNGKKELENRSNSVQKLAQVVLERPTRDAALIYKTFGESLNCELLS